MTKRNKWLSTFMVCCTPVFAAGCNPYEVGFTLLGTFVWWDLALIPVRSLLGSLALNLVNTI